MSSIADWSKIESLLTNRERGVLHLHFVAGWSRSDIASMLLINRGNVTRIIARAEKKIHDAGLCLRLDVGRGVCALRVVLQD